MVTTPLEEETPELTPRASAVALTKFTVRPGIGILFLSTTVAVMVAEFELSEFTELLDVLRMILSGIGVIVTEGGGGVPGAPPPPLQPINASAADITTAANDLCNFDIDMFIPGKNSV
jgi:hypothetical protein